MSMIERGLSMNKYDIDEKKIHDMFSQITVDSSKLVKEVKTKLHKIDTNTQVKNHKPWIKSTVAAMALVILLVGSATAVVLGNFEGFMKRFNPSFSNIVEPVESYVEDQGIRMEIIGAQKYDNRAIVYLSLQDITGKNRLTEETNFRDGFNVKINKRTKDIDMKRNEETFGFSWRQKMIYFEEITNTVYYEFNITTDLDTPLTDKLELGSSLIYFDMLDFIEEPINISLEKIKVADTLPINARKIWGGNNIGDNRDLYTKALIPGNFGSMPHGEKEQWISNVGIIDGKLHVQIGTVFNKKFGTTDAHIDLKDEKGNIISYDYSLVLLADEKNNILDLARNDYADAIYKYKEFIFPVRPENLSKYNLLYTGSVSTGVEGNWMVATNLTDSIKNILTWTNDILIEGHNFEYITLSPLGLNAMGSYKGESFYASDMTVKIETLDDIIQLESGGGSRDSEKQRFSSSWDAETPLDIERVTAIIINRTRIPIQ